MVAKALNDCIHAHAHTFPYNEQTWIQDIFRYHKKIVASPTLPINFVSYTNFHNDFYLVYLIRKKHILDIAILRKT